ncbi:MAG TPA: hypothetical protein VGS20_03765 [Candidatus Acidoferrales bacterium]|nr:hypothetical protein [Candidatus Acidoferrales bacterium]
MKVETYQAQAFLDDERHHRVSLSREHAVRDETIAVSACTWAVVLAFGVWFSLWLAGALTHIATAIPR